MKFVFQKMIFFMQLTLVAINIHFHFASANVGAVYGMSSDNLPRPKTVISLYKSEKIPLLRLYEPHPDVLVALRGSGLKVAVGVRNVDIESIAIDTNTATEWVKTHIVPYFPDVRIVWIVVGNDLVPGPGAEHVSVAMNNILSGLNVFGLTEICVTTAVSTKVLVDAPLPSDGDFTSEAADLMSGIIYFLRGTNNPLMINVNVYDAHISDPAKIPLAFAIFNAYEYVLLDGKYEYSSQFEAMVDTFFAALEKNSGEVVPLVVGETGWPSAGNEPHTSPENALKFNQGLINKMSQQGTPKRNETNLAIFISTMFNEDRRTTDVGKNWGIHYPNETRVYDLDFSIFG